MHMVRDFEFNLGGRRPSLVGVSCFQEFASRSGSIGIPVQEDEACVMNQPVGHGYGQDVNIRRVESHGLVPDRTGDGVR
jgi:hypothetical protein